MWCRWQLLPTASPVKDQQKNFSQANKKIENKSNLDRTYFINLHQVIIGDTGWSFPMPSHWTLNHLNRQAAQTSRHSTGVPKNSWPVRMSFLIICPCLSKNGGAYICQPIGKEHVWLYGCNVITTWSQLEIKLHRCQSRWFNSKTKIPIRWHRGLRKKTALF